MNKLFVSNKFAENSVT